MPSPIVLDLTTQLDAQPEAVWTLLTDWERQGEWMLEARNFEVVGEQRTGIGTRARATVRIAGITTTDIVTVTEWDPPRRLTIAHEGWVSGSGTFTLTPADAGTRLRWVEELRPPLGWVGAAGMRLLRPVFRRIFERDLRVLRGLVGDGTAGR